MRLKTHTESKLRQQEKVLGCVGWHSKGGGGIEKHIAVEI